MGTINIIEPDAGPYECKLVGQAWVGQSRAVWPPVSGPGGLLLGFQWQICYG